MIILTISLFSLVSLYGLKPNILFCCGNRRLLELLFLLDQDGLHGHIKDQMVNAIKTGKEHLVTCTVKLI